MKKIFFLLSAVAFVTLSMSFIITIKNEERILWNKDMRLTWDDFKGKPDKHSPFEALTDSGLQFNMATKGDSVSFLVESYFQPNTSWVKPASKTNDKLLRHEQTHFDITELFVRKLRKTLCTGTYTFKTIQAKTGSLNEKTNKELGTYQERYDSETNHSKNEDAQNKWEEKVAKELDELKDYSTSTITKFLK